MWLFGNKFCTVCGTKLRRGIRFCEKCGADLKKQKQVPPVQDKDSPVQQPSGTTDRQ